MNTPIPNAEFRAEVAWMDDTSEGELEALANQLSILVPTRQRPPRWLARDFNTRIAAVRTSVADVTDGLRLAEHLTPDPEDPAGGRRERVAGRLARDATAVALALRWLEIETGLRLPSWPDILRRRTLSFAPLLAESDAALWFG